MRNATDINAHSLSHEKTDATVITVRHIGKQGETAKPMTSKDKRITPTQLDGQYPRMKKHNCLIPFQWIQIVWQKKLTPAQFLKLCNEAACIEIDIHNYCMSTGSLVELGQHCDNCYPTTAADICHTVGCTLHLMAYTIIRFLPQFKGEDEWQPLHFLRWWSSFVQTLRRLQRYLSPVIATLKSHTSCHCFSWYLWDICLRASETPV